MEGADSQHTRCCAPRQGSRQPEITQHRGTSSPDSACRGTPFAGSGMEGEHLSREDVAGTACSIQLQQFLWGLFLAEDGLGGGNRFQPYCNH